MKIIHWTLRLWLGAMMVGVGFGLLFLANRIYPGCVQEIWDLWMARLKKELDGS